MQNVIASGIGSAKKSESKCDLQTRKEDHQQTTKAVGNKKNLGRTGIFIIHQNKVYRPPIVTNHSQQISMQQEQSIQIARLRLRLERPLRSGEAPALRGFFGRKFEDEVLMHNHGPNDELIYQYPKIQFKIVDSIAYLLGINEGADLLETLWLAIDQTKIGEQELKVLDAQFDWENQNIEVVTAMIEYQFVNPWLALNQKNFQEYSENESRSYRIDKLNRTLIGNILSFCKSMGIFLQDRIEADCSKLTSFNTTLKGQSMIGFVGTFQTSIILPDLLGLGKSVSRGFGTLLRKARA